MTERGIILKTAVQVGEVMQDFELELHPPNVDHSQTVKATFGGCSYSSKGCVNLPASTAVFRIMELAKHNTPVLRRHTHNNTPFFCRLNLKSQPRGSRLHHST